MVKNNKRPWLLLLPCLIIMLSLVYYPVIRTFFYSLMDFKLTKPDQTAFVGLKNYLKVFRSQDFYRAGWNSLLVLAWVVGLTMVGSIFVGSLLNRPSRLSSTLTAIAILPWALPPIVNGIIWRFIFHSGYGLMNKLFIGWGLTSEPIQWTGNKYLLLFVVSVAVAWRVIPFCALIILANLQQIPQSLYEAARMDGASKQQEFWQVTLPLILPSFGIILIQATMAGINVFDEIISIAGYAKESQTLLLYNYMNTFSFLDFGFGSAITYVIMILSGIFGYFYIRSLKIEG